MGEILVCLFMSLNFLICKMRLTIFTNEVRQGRDLYYGTFSSETLPWTVDF